MLVCVRCISSSGHNNLRGQSERCQVEAKLLRVSGRYDAGPRVLGGKYVEIGKESENLQGLSISQVVLASLIEPIYRSG